MLRPLLEKQGARIVAYRYAAGQSSLMLILDVPDDLTAEAAGLMTASNGAFRDGSAVRLLSGPQWVEALTAAQLSAAEYIPPGQT